MHRPLNMKTLQQIRGERIRAEMAKVRKAMTILAIRAAAQTNGKVGV